MTQKNGHLSMSTPFITLRKEGHFVPWSIGLA